MEKISGVQWISILFTQFLWKWELCFEQRNCSYWARIIHLMVMSGCASEYMAFFLCETEKILSKGKKRKRPISYLFSSYYHTQPEFFWGRKWHLLSSQIKNKFSSLLVFVLRIIKNAIKLSFPLLSLLNQTIINYIEISQKSILGQIPVFKPFLWLVLKK